MQREGSGIALRWLLPVAVLLGTAAFALPLCRRSIVLSDEGYLLLQALEISQGSVLYRDLDAFVTPGVWLLLAGLFRIFEPSVWVSRLPVFVAYLALVGITFRTVFLATSRRAYALGAVLALMVMTVWAFPVWTFAFYSPFSILFSLVALERILTWHQDGKARTLMLCGLAAGLAIAFKQNYGVFALLGCGMAWWMLRTDRADGASPGSLRNEGIQLFGGVGLIGLPLVIYFGVNGALGAALDRLVLHPLRFAADSGIPYPPPWEIFTPNLLSDLNDRLTYMAHSMNFTASPSSWLASWQALERMHLGLYDFAPLILLLGLGLAIRPARRDRVLASVVTVCGLVFLGVFPRADFNHLINVYQPVVVASAVVLHRLGSIGRHWGRVALTCAALLFVPYAAVSVYWYAQLIHSKDAPLDLPRAGVLIHPLEAYLIQGQVKTVRSLTRPGEAVLTVPDLAMLNFLAERPAPSRYFNLYQHHIAHDQGEEVVRSSKDSDVRLAITRYDDFFSDRVGLREYAPSLVDYIRRSFEPILVSGNQGLIFWQRRNVPHEPSSSVDLLTHCHGTQEGSRHIIREHLLFSSLYHLLPPNGVQETIETQCTLHIPKHAELVVRIGYRWPLKVAAYSKLRATITAIDGNERRVLLREPLRLRPQTRWNLPPHPERRIDLSAFAGKRVTFVLRTDWHGQARMSPLERMGFSMVWQDPRIEAGVGASD